MTDNVGITTGSDASVATDDVSGVHYQLVKLADGTADSSTVIAAGGGAEAAALRVTLASDSTGVVSIDDNGGVLTVDTQAVADTGNSTTTPLGSGGNFTGSAFDLNGYSSWSISIYSDKASSSNGMVIQWSEDGTNWDFSDAQTYAAAAGNMITFGRKARYVRLNFTNTNSAQATFRVYAWGQPISVRQTRKFVGNALVDQDTGQVVVAATQGHSSAGGGAWVDVKVTPAGAVVTDGSGVTQPVSGTVTANLAAGSNNIGDVDVLSIAAGDNNIGNVDIASIAAGDNNIGNVDVVTLPSLAAGTNNIGDVDVLSIAAGDNNIGNVDIVTLPATAGAAASTINSTSSDGGTALTSTAQAIKAAAGVLYGYYIYNPNTIAAYVNFYNTAQGSVSVGTTNPLFQLTIPPTAAANLWMQPGGITFGTAMSWSATATAGGNGAPTTALDAVCWYA